MTCGGSKLQMDFRLDHTQGFGAVMARMGLEVDSIRITREHPELRDGPPTTRGRTFFELERPQIRLDLGAVLQEGALMKFLVPPAVPGMASYVVLEFEYDKGTQETAEKLVPQILEAFRAGPNGELGKRAAMMLGMLLMEMLWAATS